jgi:hypothetical protein
VPHNRYETADEDRLITVLGEKALGYIQVMLIKQKIFAKSPYERPAAPGAGKVGYHRSNDTSQGAEKYDPGVCKFTLENEKPGKRHDSLAWYRGHHALECHQDRHAEIAAGFDPGSEMLNQKFRYSHDTLFVEISGIQSKWGERTPAPSWQI